MKTRLSMFGIAVAMAVTAWPAGVAVAASCSDPLPQGSEPVTLDPAEFTGPIDNEYWPMSPGSKWFYRESDPEGKVQKVVVAVKTRTKEILGITATVVHDVVTEDGAPVEKTFDWYAQDDCGTVWYLGEDTKEYENGQVVSTTGSWESGVDGAQPGVAVPGDPQVGVSYRQEYYAGEAEDAAEVLSLDERAQVPAGSYRHALLTKDSTPLFPKILEYKLYAPGLGPVLILGVSGGSDREELLRFVPGVATTRA